MVRMKAHFEEVKVKVPPKLYEPTKEERQSHEATYCPFDAWCEICVKAKSPDGRHTKQLTDTEHVPFIEFDCAFATDTEDPMRLPRYREQSLLFWQGERVARMIK